MLRQWRCPFIADTTLMSQSNNTGQKTISITLY